MLEELHAFHFIRPLALALVPVVVGVWWLWRRRSDPLRGWRAQVDPRLLDVLIDRPTARLPRRWPMLLAWLLGVVALAGPAWRPEPSPFADDAVPLIVLLKADTSMDTPDPEPSRLERAQLKIADLAVARAGLPLGLIAYAGSAHLVLPPTRDTAVVASMAAEITPAIMPEPGDRLDLAISRATELLGGDEGTLLVVTDTASGASPEIAAGYREAGQPFVQILAITPAGASAAALRPLAKALDAEAVPMTVDGADIEGIVRRAARPPVARDGDGGERWQDGGYYLVPLLATFALVPFRRRESENEEGQP